MTRHRIAVLTGAVAMVAMTTIGSTAPSVAQVTNAKIGMADHSLIQNAYWRGHRWHRGYYGGGAGVAAGIAAGALIGGALAAHRYYHRPYAYGPYGPYRPYGYYAPAYPYGYGYDPYD